MTCKHENSKLILKTRKGNIHKCLNCNLNFLKKNEFTSYDTFYSEEGKRFNYTIEFFVKLFRLTRAIQIKLNQSKTKSVLDIGCGRGYTLYYLKKYLGVKKVVGTQLSKNAVNFARKKLNLTIHHKCLSEIKFNNEKFDTITMYHVLEHLDDPEKYISIISNTLNKNGELIIEVPNFNSWTSKITKKYWLGLDLKNHTYFFTPKSLKQLLLKHNLKVKKIKYFSLEYSAFTSTSSIISYLTKSDHIFYNFLIEKKISVKTLIHAILFLTIFPVNLLINLILVYNKNGEIIQIIAKK